MCLSRQFALAFNSPSSNHLKNGGFDSSSVCVNGLVQITFSRASRLQKAFGSFSASAQSAW